MQLGIQPEDQDSMMFISQQFKLVTSWKWPESVVSKLVTIAHHYSEFVSRTYVQKYPNLLLIFFTLVIKLYRSTLKQ